MMFKVGQKVVNHIEFKGESPDGVNLRWVKRPTLNDIYVVTGYRRPGYVQLKGFDDWGFDEEKFMPVDETFAKETLRDIERQILIEESDLLIKKLEEYVTSRKN